MTLPAAEVATAIVDVVEVGSCRSLGLGRTTSMYLMAAKGVRMLELSSLNDVVVRRRDLRAWRFAVMDGSWCLKRQRPGEPGLRGCWCYLGSMCCCLSD